MSEVVLIMLLVFGASLAIGTPIAVAVISTGLIAVWVLDYDSILLVHYMVAAMNSFTLIAIPCFLFLGAIMGKAGITERVIEFCIALFGWLRGGLSIVTMFASMIVAGMSGSASADTAAIGSATIPALLRENYERGYAAAMVAAGGSLGIIIPPSIPMIIYGATTETSISGMFLGGYLPGLVLGAAFMVLLYFVARKRQYGSIAEFRPSHVWASFRKSFLSLLTPIIIVGGIIAGVMTPTESGVVGVAYVLVLGFIVHRELKIADLFPALVESAVLTGVVMFIVGASGLLGWVMAAESIPAAMVSGIMSISENKYVILLLINILLLVLGALVDTVALLIIVVPIIAPIGVALGLDPIHFGVMVVFNLAIGLLTPPIGYCLFVAAAIARAPVGLVSIRIVPFVAVATVVLMLVTYVPAVTMYIPHLFGK